MFKETVEVEDVFKDKVKIKFTKKTACSCCRLISVCGQGKNSLVIDSAGLSLAKGDKVEVAIDEKFSLLASVLSFLLPAAIFVTSLVAFRARGELFSFLLALAVVCLYYIVLKVALKVKGKRFNLKILRKL